MTWSISAVSDFGMRVEWYLHCGIPRNRTRARTHAQSTCVQEAQAKEHGTKEHSCLLLEEDIRHIPTRNKPQARNYLLITAPTIDHGCYFLSDVDFFLLR
jgi:hypothetical protein